MQQPNAVCGESAYHDSKSFKFRKWSPGYAVAKVHQFSPPVQQLHL